MISFFSFFHLALRSICCCITDSYLIGGLWSSGLSIGESMSLIYLASPNMLTQECSGENRCDPELSLFWVAPSDKVAWDGRFFNWYKSFSLGNSSVTICVLLASDASISSLGPTDALGFVSALICFLMDFWFIIRLFSWFIEVTLCVKVIALLLLVLDSILADSQLIMIGLPPFSSSCTATKYSFVLRGAGLGYTLLADGSLFCSKSLSI